MPITKDQLNEQLAAIERKLGTAKILASNTPSIIRIPDVLESIERCCRALRKEIEG